MGRPTDLPRDEPVMIEIALTEEVETEKSKDEIPKSVVGRIWYYMKLHRRMLVRLLIMLLFLVAIIVLFFVLAKTGLLEKALDWIHRKTGHWGLAIIAAGEIIAGFPIPNLFTLFAIFGGLIYGFWKAFLVAFPFACIGYTVSFIFCRRFLRERVKKMMQEEFTFFNDVEELIEKEAWKFVFLLRFSPIPFGILNMILSTTKIPLHVFVIAGIIPTCVEMAVYSYLGTTLKSISEAINSHHMGPVQIVMICVNIVATILVLIIVAVVGKRAYKNLQEKKKQIEQDRLANMNAVQTFADDGEVIKHVEEHNVKSSEDDEMATSSPKRSLDLTIDLTRDDVIMRPPTSSTVNQQIDVEEISIEQHAV